MPALLFGSISTLADTSELQRSAFNAAFADHGLEWVWDREQYRELLTGNGGQQRVADHAAARGEDVDAAAVHQSKSVRFQDSLRSGPVAARPGVVETIRAAKGQGWRVALVTTTSPDNIDALLGALAPALSADDFDLIVDNEQVTQSKPDPASFEFAVRELGEQPGECVAVEDNVGGVQAAQAAGITCFAFPNSNTAGHDFGATPRLDKLSFDALAARAIA